MAPFLAGAGGCRGVGPVDLDDGPAVRRVIGEEVDVHTAPKIQEAVIKLLDEGHRHFILDLCPAPFLDSMGLGMIVAITKRIRDHEGSLRLICTDDRILRVFRRSGLRKVYAFHDSVGQATLRTPRRGGLAYWPRSFPT
ncbi:STAS domain-containing protein [Streptomyces sp. NPDC056309]|uniref:STAS domain-containing protein n=1 Tax=unclassified Streptomyces TaxID=2593676 RepID=UPI0035DE4ABE